MPFNYSKINQFIQGRPSLNEGFTQTLTPGLRTNFKVAPNISLRYRYSVIEIPKEIVKLNSLCTLLLSLMPISGIK